MTITLKRTVNLSEPVLPEVLSAPLYEGEQNAHTFMITAEKDKLPHALSGSVVAYFERNDGNTVRVEGETKDGAALLTLSPECYQTGVFYLAVMLIADGAQTVIYAASGRVRNTQDGEIIDGGNTIPTYDEIMAHLNKYLSTDITAKVEETEDGAIITMKDVVNGETTAVVKNGKSAYDVAVDNGFKGTQEEWLDSLKGDENIFVVHVAIDENYNYIADKTADEVRAAVNAGKLPAMFESGGDIRNTYLYCGEKTLNSVRLPYFQTLPLDGANGHKVIMAAYLKNDKTVEANAEFPMTAVTENKLTIKYGDQETKFDGSKAETVSIKDDLFVIRIDTSNKSDKTQAEVRAAAAAGKCLVLIDAGSGRTALYAGEFADKNDPSGMRPGFITQMRNDGQDIDYALSYYYLNADGKFTVKTHKPVETPTPLPLTIKTTDKTIYFDGSSEESIDLTGLGSGGGQFYFTVTENDSGIKSSKTFAEIKAAYDAGLEPVCVYDWETVIDSQRKILYKKILTLEIGAIYKNADFHAFIKESLVFPYNYIQIDIKENDDGSNLITINKSRYASFNDIPTKLPNPASLTIKQGSNSWTYSGAEAQTVNLPSMPTALKNPNSLNIKVNGVSNYYDGSSSQTVSLEIPEAVTSLPWDKITDKPFGESTVFDQQIKFTEQNILIPTPFDLQDGVKYTITAGNPANGGMSFTDTAVAGNADGMFDYIGIGNPGILGVGADNGEPYVFFSIPGGVDTGDAKIYGMLVITEQLFAMVQGATLPVKVELTDGATPVPEELIPTMSETTKGGAKVGKGLKMDGDTLNVDEGVYELIETIALEETMAIERTAEPDGTPYKFSAVAIRVKKSEGITISPSLSMQAITTLNNLHYLYLPATTTTNEQWCYAEVRQYKGFWERERAAVWSIYNSTDTPMHVKIPMFDKKVSDGEYIRMVRGNSVQAGLIIEIWGVRA